MEVEDVLAHHGVKGMKWGKRKTARVARNQSIVDARERQYGRSQAYDSLAAKHALMVSKKGKESVARQMDKLKDEYVSGEDAKIAAKLTSGEKAVNALLLTGIGLTIAGTVGTSLKSFR